MNSSRHRQLTESYSDILGSLQGIDQNVTLKPQTRYLVELELD